MAKDENEKNLSKELTQYPLNAGKDTQDHKPLRKLKLADSTQCFGLRRMVTANIKCGQDVNMRDS